MLLYGMLGSKLALGVILDIMAGNALLPVITELLRND